MTLKRAFENIVGKGENATHDKILDPTKLKAFVDDKLNVTKMIIYVFDRLENIVGKREIACTNNCSFSHNVFKRLLSQTRQQVSLCGNGLNVDRSKYFFLPTRKCNPMNKGGYASERSRYP